MNKIHIGCWLTTAILHLPAGFSLIALTWRALRSPGHRAGTPMTATPRCEES